MIPIFAALAALLIVPVAQPSMASLWPNQDGSSWGYHQTYQAGPGGFGNPDTTETLFRLHFDGTVAVPGRSDAQNLVEEEVVASAPSLAATPDAFLRTLWLARPDLRDALGQRGVTGAAAQVPEWAALLVHGGAFEKTAQEIRIWRTDTTGLLSWVFLRFDLSLGHMFSLQLVPDLAPDVFLYATVGGLENVTVPAGSYTGCQRVDYRIDYGESICTGEGSSEPLGTFRGQTLGYVLYAPDVGPVFSFEELSYTDVTGDCGVTPDVVVERVILKLTEAPVSTEPVTWGGLKARH